jgi:hypothetical protein
MMLSLGRGEVAMDGTTRRHTGGSRSVSQLPGARNGLAWSSRLALGVPMQAG